MIPKAKLWRCLAIKPDGTEHSRLFVWAPTKVLARLELVHGNQCGAYFDMLISGCNVYLSTNFNKADYDE